MPPLLKAQLLLARLEYLGSLTGPEVKARVLRCLPEEERERLRQLTSEAWVPFRTLTSLDHAIRSVLAPGDDTVFVELGRASARQRTEWLGEHAPLVSLHGFLSNMAEQHRRYHTFGRAEYHRLGFRHGQIAFFEFPEVDLAYCLSGSGYLTGAIEMLGGARPLVQEVSCQCRGQEACRYDLRWEEKGAPAESQR